MIKTFDLEFHYVNDDDIPTPPALKNVNFSVNEGEFVAVLGHNGSGKSTLAKHFNAILLPTGGFVHVMDIDTNILNDEKDADSILLDIRKNVGMIFQNPDNQIVSGIVEEDVAFALENLGVEHGEMVRRVNEALKLVDMEKYANHAPHLLSGGQKQRVAIAGIIAMQPKCIVLDEPTAMLDPKGRKEVLESIIRLNKENGVTVILITHYMNEAINADRVVVINSGEIALEGTPKAVFSQVEKIRELKLDVPQETALLYELSKCGFKLPIDVLSVSDCANAIESLFAQ